VACFFISFLFRFCLVFSSFFRFFVLGVGGFFWAVSFSFLLCPSFLLVVFSSSASLPSGVGSLPAGALSPSWVAGVRSSVGVRWCPRPCSVVLSVLLGGGVPPLLAVPLARLLAGVPGVSVVWCGRGSSAPLVASAWVSFFRGCGFSGAFSAGSGACCWVFFAPAS